MTVYKQSINGKMTQRCEMKAHPLLSQRLPSKIPQKKVCYGRSLLSRKRRRIKRAITVRSRSENSIWNELLPRRFYNSYKEGADGNSG